MLRPQRITAATQPTADVFDLTVDLVSRLARALLDDDKVLPIFQEELASVLDQFTHDHHVQIEAALDDLLGFVTPAIKTFEQLADALEDGDLAAVIGTILDKLCAFLDLLSMKQVEAVLNRLFDIVEDNLGEVIDHFADQLINPALDRIVARLQADYRGGVGGAGANNQFLLGKDIDRFRTVVMGQLALPSFDRALLLQPLLDKLKNLNVDEVTSTFAGSIRDGKVVLTEALLVLSASVSFSGSVDVSVSSPATSSPGVAFPFQPAAARAAIAAPIAMAPASTDGEEETHTYLWYLSWLEGDDYWLIGDRIYRDEKKVLFTGHEPGIPIFDANGNFNSLLWRQAFEAKGIKLSDDVKRQEGFSPSIWILYDKKKDETYTIIDESLKYNVYAGPVYGTTDWGKVLEALGYSAKPIKPGALEWTAFISHFSKDLLKIIPHAASAERGDFLSNLANLTIHTTYGSLNVIGPSGFGWTTKDLPITNIWLKWVVPIGATLLFSLENIYTKDDCPQAFWHWLIARFGTDLIEKFLYDNWFYMGREFTLSLVTLINNRGVEETVNNRKEIEGVAFGIVEAGVWLLVEAYSKSDFGFPNSSNGDKWGILFGHLFGLGAVFGGVSAFLGSLGAWAIAGGTHAPSIGWMILKGVLVTWVKYLPSQYLRYDGDTDGGTFDGDSNTYPGYPSDAGNSPYCLPYPAEEAYECAQGNLGIWSHTPHSNESQIYAFDFAMDKGDEVRAMRGGVVDGWFDQVADHDSGNNPRMNFIRIRHTTLDNHDRDAANANVVTYASYLHGTFNSIRAIWGPRLGITNLANIVPNDIIGRPVAQGELIMFAGDTGRSAYNHLHIHVKPQIGGVEGNYTIPFVFADVEGDGVPKSLDMYESANKAQPSADLALQMSVDLLNPGVGTTVTYTLTVSNNGPANAPGVAVTNALPAGMTFVSANPATDYDSPTGVWTVGTLNNGDSAVLTISATVDASGTFVNNAAVSARAVIDADATNDRASQTIIAP